MEGRTDGHVHSNTPSAFLPRGKKSYYTRGKSKFFVGGVFSINMEKIAFKGRESQFWPKKYQVFGQSFFITQEQYDTTLRAKF